MKTVSVIVPVYNVEPFLERCIRSILRQSFTNFELILVDDGSKDNSAEICDQFCEIDSRIHVIHQLNQGVSVARNTGINAATGRYIMFCDADDWVASNWIEKHIEVIQEKPNAWIVSGVDYVSQQQHSQVFPIDNTNTVNEIPTTDYFLIHKQMLDGYCFNKVYRTDIIHKNGLEFQPGIAYAEDVQFNIAYLKHCECIVTLPITVYYFNAENNMSATRKYNPKRFDNHLFAYNLRKPVVASKYKTQFANMFYGTVIWNLELLFRKEDPRTLLEKYRYGNYILQCKEFQECLSDGANNGMNVLYRWLLHTGNSILVMGYLRITNRLK